MEQGIELGVSVFGVAGGPDPGPDGRTEETAQFRRSLLELGEAAEAMGDVVVGVEPMDREAHKRCLIGPTREAVRLLAAVREHYPGVAVSWDSAHTALNGEDLFESLSTCGDLVAQIHLSNAVLDPASADYGDQHMAIGAPGFLTADTIRAILSHCRRARGPSAGTLNVAVEVRTSPGADPWSNVMQCEAVLREALRAVETEGGGDR
jgi:sugar phosphate isomerase/epimerase